VDEAGSISHALNRGSALQIISHKDDDYGAFLRALSEGLECDLVELFAFTLMPNHWYMILRPSENGLMGRMLRWVTATQPQRYHAHDHTAVEGYVYPSCFKSFPVADDDHFLADSSSAELDRTWQSAAQRAGTASVTRVRRARPTS
jgi:putative transposase